MRLNILQSFLLSLVILFGATIASAESFNHLLKEIKSQTGKELADEKNRKRWFLNEQLKQQQQLKEAKTLNQNLAAKSERLKDSIDQNEQAITQLEEELQRKTGDLGELFGVVRQVSGELNATYQQSMISVHYPERIDFMNTLSETTGLPEIATLEKMWVSMLDELDEGRKVSKFEAPVVQFDGTTKLQEIIRIGAYGAVSEGEFLLYSAEEVIFEKLLKQPSSRYHASADNFTNVEDGFVKVMVDPTRGQLLTMLTQKPTLEERVHQGGIVGYIIIALGIIGILIAFIRYGHLSYMTFMIRRQIKNMAKPSAKNALGRIAIAYESARNKSHEQKETLLEEVIMKEIPRVEKYNSLIKLLAAVSPLLGLLGTVTGMIITFQSITLFGTSDPKLMAGGISTALVTTVLGLTVAIPLLFAYTFIAAKTKYIIDTIEHQAVGLIAKDY